MWNLRKSASLMLLVMISLFGISCGDSSEGTLTGTLNLSLTDAPFPSDDVSEANVTIVKIDIRNKDEVDGNPFLTLTEDTTSFNLLDLTNGVTASLVNMEVPVGTYDLIRLYVYEASIVLKDGTTFDLSVPSGAQTGIKIFIDPAVQVAGGLSADLLLDFDVSESFVPQGSSASGYNGFIFTPVLRVANLSTSGRLVGSVKDIDENGVAASISVISDETKVGGSEADAAGEYTVLGLEAGTYSVVFEHANFEADTVENVEIVAGNATTLDVVLEE